nr:hydrogenase maturation protease [Archaeoglobus neptunius]
MGVGNLLMGDDGIGIRVVRELMNRRLPKGVDIVEGGTLSFQLVNFFSEYDLVIVVDAVNFGGRPGRIYKLTLDDVPVKITGSVHDVDVFTACKVLRMACELPPVIIIGVEVKRIQEFAELSPELALVVRKVVKKILRMITPSSGRRGRIRRRRVRRLTQSPT